MSKLSGDKSFHFIKVCCFFETRFSMFHKCFMAAGMDLKNSCL